MATMPPRFAMPVVFALLVMLSSSLLPALSQDALAQVVINEVDYDQPGTDAAEFIELYNAGIGSVNLDLYTVELVNGTGGGASVYQTIDLPAVTLAAGGYFVICGDAANVPNCDLDVTPDENLIQNGAPDAIGLRNGGTLVDALSYEGDTGAPYTETTGSGVEDPAGNADFGISRFPNGADTDNNSADFTALGITPGTSNGVAVEVIVINEVDYDQPGTDAAEFIELYNAGIGSVNLDLYTVELVNGTGGGASVYQTIDLPAVTLAAGGYFVICGDAANVPNCDLDVTPDENLIQNGAPDAIGLRNGGTLVDALSYEGDTGAPYTETTGTGVEDPGTTGSDFLSISRLPDGADTDDNSADFATRCITPGSGNTADTANCPDPNALPALVINEIDYDQPGTDSAEFIELKNTGATAIGLDPFDVVLVNGNGTSVYQTIDLPAVTLAAGGYFVICANAATTINCDLDVTPDENLIQNGSPDAVALVQGSILIDVVSYEGDTGAPYTEGSGSGLEDSGSAGNDFGGISRFPDGADTDMNNVDLSARCISPGSANLMADTGCQEPVQVSLVINEVDADTPGTDAAEFIELFDGGVGNVSLDGYVVVLFNGSSDTSYDAFDLDGQSTDANGFFVLCGDAANVPNCDLDVSPNTNLIQNGADAVALYTGDATDFPGGTAVTTTDLVDALVYDTDDADDAGLLVLLNAGQPQVNENGNGDKDNESNQRIPNGDGGPRNTDTYAQTAPTPGEVNRVEVFAEIYEIQGNGLASPFDGQVVTTLDNVVTVVGTDGFFIQTPTARTDGDGNTSDGIYVFTGSAPTVGVGDQVDVTGEVDEFFDFTEFTNNPVVTIDGPGTLPAPVVFDGATPSPDPTALSCADGTNYECFEGMLIEITGGAVGGPNQRFGTDPIAEVHIVAGGTRPFREPGIEFPGMPGLPVWDGNPEVFELDPDRLGLPNQIIPAGSSFDAVGALGYEFGGYEFWPSSLTVTPAVLPDPVRAAAAGESTVGSLNVFRLFDAVDDPAEGDGRDDAVVSAAEYQRRLDKFSLYIRTVLGSPDILAVQEAEKLGVLQDLAAEIQADDPTITYAAYLIEGNDIGTIDVGFLVRTDRVQVDAVTQLGKNETFVDPTDNSVDILHDRPPLLLEGAFTGISSQPRPIAVMAVHMRSLSGIETARVQRKRLEQAQSVAQMVQDFQTANPATGLVVTGDFNAFEFTDGFVHLVGRIQGDFDDTQDSESGPDLVDPNLTNQVLGLDPSERYSFIFGGTAQVLDHALTTTALDGAVTGFAYGRGNADAAVDLINDDSTPLRASDHDGLVLFLDVAPPEITVAEEPIVLDPPNHSYHTVNVADFVTGVTDATLADVYIVSVTSDEEENGNGDGNTTDDIVISSCQSVDLRAERQGGGNGRVYTVTVAASDAAGNVGTASFEVWVPKGKKKPAINDGAAYEVLSGCSAPAANASVAEATGEALETATLAETPSDYVLSANYPNPFNPTTTIEYALPEAAVVRLTVYDVTGREVAQLVDQAVSAGHHRVSFDASGLPSGVYFYRLTAPGFTQTQRMVLMK